jgi:HAMP domain-containing protein
MISVVCHDVAFATVGWRLHAGLLFTLTTLLLAFSIAWMLSRKIARPLRQLAHDASALAGGDFGHRTPVAASGEVGLLAASFNQMAAALQERQRDARSTADAPAPIGGDRHVDCPMDRHSREVPPTSRHTGRLGQHTPCPASKRSVAPARSCDIGACAKTA